MTPVARGPVPRDRDTLNTVARGPVPREKTHRNPVARGPVPREAHPDHRSARACPSRSLDCANATMDRGMARDRPSPYGEGGRFFTVARGPVPREKTPRNPVARGPVPRDRWIARVLRWTQAWRGTGPRPTMKRRLPHNRSAGACPPRSPDLRENRTPATALSRADRGMARDRPSPYGEGGRFFPVARGPVPREKMHRNTVARGPVPRDRNTLTTVARGPVPRDRQTRAKTERQPRLFPGQIEAWRGTGPRPTVRGGVFSRRARACPPRT